MTAVYGWCNRRPLDGRFEAGHNGAFDHLRTEHCEGFVSDSEHTARLLRDAREHDRQATVQYSSGATDPAADYVAQHVPEAMSS